MDKLHNVTNNKPTYIKFAEDVDFYELFQKVEQEFETCFLLESLGKYSDLSRYSIVGFDPLHLLSAKGNALYIDGKRKATKNAYLSLRNIVPQHTMSRDYAGGLIGYMSYEALNYIEPSLSVQIHPLFDQFRFGIYTDGLILDKRTNEIFYFYYDKDRLNEVKKMLKTSLKKKQLSATFQGYGLSKREHKKAVKQVKEQIITGNTFQCQVGFKSEFYLKGDTVGCYTRVRHSNPWPFMYYRKFGNKKIIGASPELLFRLKAGEMETYPLAGTVARGKTVGEDRMLSRKLLHDSKEIAEHNMLVDLHRNDLGRVAEFGSVQVKSLMDVKTFSHVQHISSEITGRLRQGEDMFSGLASNFPAGTLTGAPKIESVKIIDRMEKDARGPYGGAVGHFGFNGDCTFAISIRSLYVSGNYAFSQTSGGIVYDSKPEDEYQEIMRKSQAIKEVLGV